MTPQFTFVYIKVILFGTNIFSLSVLFLGWFVAFIQIRISFHQPLFLSLDRAVSGPVIKMSESINGILTVSCIGDST